MSQRKTWREKYVTVAEPTVQVLEKSGMGMKAGDRMLISTPAEIEAEIRRIPEGETLTPAELREELAASHGADVTCPLTTGIFLRIVSECALEELGDGNADIAPFWRVVDPTSDLAKKLSCGPDWIAEQRNYEALTRA